MNTAALQTEATIKNSCDSAQTFLGFESIDANFIYCPNQFFDVCLPHCSRGAVRLVAYLLHQTLKWRDENGDPINQDISASYRELIDSAGISRGAIQGSIDEAIERRFISCVSPGQPKSKGKAAQTAQYALRWDAESKYLKDPSLFAGFFAREGNRSPVPAAFFERVIPGETLAVIKVVGTVLRHTVGYENQFGRRSQAPLAYSYIQQYTRLSNRSIVSEALKHAIEANYIECVQKGCFSPDALIQRAATYSIKWLAYRPNPNVGSKSGPASVQTPHQQFGTNNGPVKRFTKQTTNGSESGSENRSKNETTRKKASKHIFKQQPSAAVVSLIKRGFTERDAEQLASTHDRQVIEQQIDWLDKRNPSTNPQGMLRRAIEENWSEPASLLEQATQKARAVPDQATAAEATKSKFEGDQTANARLEKKRNRQRLETQWFSATKNQQIAAARSLLNQTTDPTEQAKILDYSFSNPPFVFLKALDQQLHSLTTTG